MRRNNRQGENRRYMGDENPEDNVANQPENNYVIYEPNMDSNTMDSDGNRIYYRSVNNIVETQGSEYRSMNNSSNFSPNTNNISPTGVVRPNMFPSTYNTLVGIHHSVPSYSPMHSTHPQTQISPSYNNQPAYQQNLLFPMSHHSNTTMSMNIATMATSISMPPPYRTSQSSTYAREDANTIINPDMPQYNNNRLLPERSPITDPRNNSPQQASSVVMNSPYDNYSQSFITSNMQTGVYISNNSVDECDRKKQIRLAKNREAARECRRKKKDYIKHLENKAASLEVHNKDLAMELKRYKDKYGTLK